MSDGLSIRPMRAAPVNISNTRGIILISHDLEVIESICGRALVLKDGAIVEELDIKEELDESGETSRFAEPESDYGKRLLEAAFADKSYVVKNK